MNKQVKEFNTSECYNVYKQMKKHSDNKWKSSLLLKNTDRGASISLQIVSIEELVKSFVFFADSKGLELRKMDSINSILSKDHSIRHFIGFIMFVVHLFLDDAKIMLENFKTNPTAATESIKDISTLEIKIKWYFLRKIPLIKKEFEWFSKMELLRQNGNHFDVNPQVKSPLEFNETDFFEVHKRLEKVRNMIRYFIISVEKDNGQLNGHFETFALHKDKMYSEMNGWVKSAAREKGGVFKLVGKKAKSLKNPGEK